MPGKPNETAQEDPLAILFLMVSFGVAIAVIAMRNLYDDEIMSLPIITGSAREILSFAWTSDVHPPGMYLLAHFSWRLLQSYRWINLFPTVVLYTGIAVFVRAVAPLFSTSAAKVGFLMIATLHPQLLLWGTCFRWYSWWTGIALMCTTAALQPRAATPRLGPVRAVFLGVLLACLFYFNYITLLFGIALMTAMFVRYREQWPKLATYLGITALVCLVLTAPLIHTLISVHLSHSRGQSARLQTSFARLIGSVTSSEAFLPWHPLAILAVAIFVFLFACGSIAFRLQHEAFRAGRDRALISLAVLGGIFFLLVGFSGLGWKPRSALALVPLIAVLAGMVFDGLHPRASIVTLVLLSLWSADGMAHILERRGLMKAMMTDRPEQVVAFIRNDSAGRCAIVATYDPGLSFAITQANLQGTVLITPFPPPVGEYPQKTSLLCAHPTLYTVRSYLGADLSWQATLDGELDSALQEIQGGRQTHRFSFDPDAARKRRVGHMSGFGSDLKNAAEVPDYRFVVTSGPIVPASLRSIRQKLNDFANTAQ